MVDEENIYIEDSNINVQYIDVYVAADVPATSHAIDLVSTGGLGCVPGGLRSVYIT